MHIPPEKALLVTSQQPLGPDPPIPTLYCGAGMGGGEYSVGCKH